MTRDSLLARIAARRTFRAYERALQKADRYGGATDLHALYRRY